MHEVFDARYAHAELFKFVFTKDRNVMGAGFDGVLGHKAPLCTVVGANKIPRLVTVEVEVDGGDRGRRHGGLPAVDAHGLHEDACHLGAHKVGQVAGGENIVVVRVGDEQAVSVLLGLGVGTVGDLQ